MQTETKKSNDPVAEAFTAISDHYASHFIPAKTGTHFCFQKRLDLVLEMTTGRNGALLDCAVGPAEITAEVLRRERFDRAVLVDITPAMIDKARQRIQSHVPVDNSNGASFLTGDIFEVIPSLEGQSFNLVFCLGLIAHTGRLDQILAKLKSVLVPGGQILLQSTLLDHIGTRIVRFLSSKHYAKKHGYMISYYTNNDILRACERNGLRIVARRRFSIGVPFGDRIWKRGNYQFEKLFSSFASRVGSEALYLLECDSSR